MRVNFIDNSADAIRSNITHLKLAPAFVLHSRPYQETSLLLTLFTQHHGKVAAIARGVRKARSKTAGLLSPFLPLLVTLRGKGELLHLQTLEAATDASYIGIGGQLRGRALFYGMYINELLVRLLHYCDPCPQLYEYYREALAALAAGNWQEVLSHDATVGADMDAVMDDASTGISGEGEMRAIKDAVRQAVLRLFEKRLLQEIGYGLQLQQTAAGEPIVEDGHYSFQIGVGFVRVLPQSSTPQSSQSEQLSQLYGDGQTGQPRQLDQLSQLNQLSQSSNTSCLRGQSLLALHYEKLNPMNFIESENLNSVLSKMYYHLIGGKFLQCRRMLRVATDQVT